MNHHDDEQDFRELPEGAAAPFPSEDEWLDLPLPAELSPAPSGGDSFAFIAQNNGMESSSLIKTFGLLP